MSAPKRIFYNLYEQIVEDDLNANGDNVFSLSQANVIKEFLNGINAVITSGLVVSQIAGDTLRLSVGQAVDANGLIIPNDNVAHDLLLANADFVNVSGQPSGVANGIIFIVQMRQFIKDGATQTRSLIDDDGNTFTQAIVKEKVMATQISIKTGTNILAPNTDAGWTKVSEIKKIGAGVYNIYNVNTSFNTPVGIYFNSSWTAEKQITHRIKTLADHRSQSALDHPFGSVTEQHLDALLQSKINSTSNKSFIDAVIQRNLLNKAPAENRDNESMEFFFGTGLDADYYAEFRLASEYLFNLENDNGLAGDVDEFDYNNASPNSLSNMTVDIHATSLFDVWLDTTKILTAINTDYDFTAEIASVTGGIVSLRPQTTWGAFKSGTNSTDSGGILVPAIVQSQDATVGTKKLTVFTNIQLYYNKAVFDAVFQGTSLNIVITKDFQVYKWDGVGVASDALIPRNFVYGYNTLLQPSTDGGVTPKPATILGENDSGFPYFKVAVDKHVVFMKENYRLGIGRPGIDCVGIGGDKYFDRFGTLAYQLKTRVRFQHGSYLQGFHRFLSVIKFTSNWSKFYTQGKTENATEHVYVGEDISVLAEPTPSMAFAPFDLGGVKESKFLLFDIEHNYANLWQYEGNALMQELNGFPTKNIEMEGRSIKTNINLRDLDVRSLEYAMRVAF